MVMKDRINIMGNYYFGGMRNTSFLIIAAGIFIWMSPMFALHYNAPLKTFFVGLVAFVAGLIIRFLRYGYSFDFSRLRYREYLYIFGLKWGKWERIDNLDTLMLSVKDGRALKSPAIVAPSNISDTPVYVIVLYSGIVPRIVIPLLNKEEAIKLSEVLAIRLNLKVRNSI